MQQNAHKFGVGANSYNAANQLTGITNLVNTFYSNMDSFPEARTIRKMHPADLTKSREKLIYFLSGWLGGPKLFSEHYGRINIPEFHQHFSIGEKERDAWLLCMQEAIKIQPYKESFKEYLLAQLTLPAERIKQMSSEKT